MLQNGSEIGGEPSIQINFDRDENDLQSSEAPASDLNGSPSHSVSNDTVSDLPVFRHRKAIIESIQNHSFIVICGETGSGKSTQIPSFLCEAGIVSGNQSKLLVTQPRRLAAVALATRVAQEMNCELGKEVGYSVRFDSRIDPNITQIKFSTEGMMSRELSANPALQGYGAVMIDEAHERTIEVDVIFGLLRESLRQRPESRIIVSSATLDAEKFANYFREVSNNPVVYTVEGRLFPVEKLYLTVAIPQENLIKTTVDTVSQIHLSNTNDDMCGILAFLPGQAEIEKTATQLRHEVESWGLNAREINVICVYSNMSVEAQTKVFKPAAAGQRKVVLATNIAETSSTIPNIGYVIDSGSVKQRQYLASAGIEQSASRYCSRASAEQRAGRAGRTSAGKCYRLYTKLQFQDPDVFEPQSKPEILRSNLSQVSLSSLSSGIADPVLFPWIDKPSTSAFVQAQKLLYTLGAVTDTACLTKLGRVFAELPTDPRWARALLSSRDNKNLVAMAIAMIGELGSVYKYPRSQSSEVTAIYNQFKSSIGDFHTSVNIYMEWSQSGFSNRWCQDNFMDLRSLRRARDVVRQLIPLTEKSQPLVAEWRNSVEQNDVCDPSQAAIVNGFFMNTARLSLNGRHYVQYTSNMPLYLHPSSSSWTLDPPPKVVVYHEIMCTTKEYMRGCMAVDPSVSKNLHSTVLQPSA